MPIKKSAVKRAKQNIVRRDKNRVLKKTFREAVKEVSRDIEGKKADQAAEDVSKAFQALDKAAKRNAIHKNAAARRKSKLMKKANQALGKAVSPKAIKVKQENKPAKKPAAKKSTPKKSK